MTPLATILKWILTALPFGTLLGWVAKRVWRPDILITGRRDGRRYRFVIDYGEDEPLNAAITLTLRPENKAGAFTDGPRLLCGPRHAGTTDRLTEQGVYEVTAERMPPFGLWAIDCEANGLEHQLSLLATIRQGKRTYLFPAVATEPAPRARAGTRRYLWLALCAALAAYLWPFALQYVWRSIGFSHEPLAETFVPEVDVRILAGMSTMMVVIYLLLARFWRIGPRSHPRNGSR